MTRASLILLILMAVAPLDVMAQTPEKIVLRGKVQTLQLYGRHEGDPVIVSSGDGGWVHLGPQISELLAARGYFVVGFDTKAYLESFTSGTKTLTTKDVPADYREIVRSTGGSATRRPLLVGVSEGAALSLLAATEPDTKAMIAGVVGLGLGDRNELAWRWKDAMIYVTHGVPNEPTFSALEFAPRVAPTPLAVINSIHDEFVPPGEVASIISAAGNPKRLWMINAADHRFSDAQAELAQRLAEAIDWIRQNQKGL